MATNTIKNISIKDATSSSGYDTREIGAKAENIEMADGANLEEKVTSLTAATDTKVDKVEGKGLSTNDFTTEEKEKLEGVEEGAQVNTVTGIKGNAETSYRTGEVNITPANVGAAPVNHAAAGTAYGVGSDTNYGHVKLSDTYNTAVEGDGIAASQNAVYNSYNELNSKIASTQNFTSESACRWLRFSPDNHKALVIKGGTTITTKGGVNFKYDEDTTIDLTSYLGNKGTDYFVHIAEDGTISASTTKSTSIKCIGRFHTLCADVGTPTMIAPASPSSGLKVGGTYLVKSYKEEDDPDFYAFYNKTITAVTVQSAYDVITMAHPLSGYVAGDILPESVFCTTFYPSALYDDAMVYDKDTDRIIDVYIQSGTGFNTRSKYGATHTVSRTSHNHREDMRMVGKRLLKDSEFTSAALGSNERTAITGSKDQTTVGGHVDTANRRMISAIGCEEMCGYILTWLDEVAPVGGSAWGVTDTHGSFGQEYGTPYVLKAGGAWTSSSYCGSRCRISDGSRLSVGARSGGRGSSRVVRG